MTDIVLAVPLGAASFQRALETVSPAIAGGVPEAPKRAPSLTAPEWCLERCYRVREYFAKKEASK